MDERRIHSDIPPGIEGNLKYYISGGEGAEWMSFEAKKYYTNAFVVQEGKVLLGYKKRGFGRHKYNGFGGKVEEGETCLQAALRELEEEAGIIAPLEYAGSLLFITEGIEKAFQIEIYRATEYSGAIHETDEMIPEWFSLGSSDENDVKEVPFDKMWDTDRHWLPLLVSGRKFVGRADFKCSGEVFTPHKWWYGVPA